jgi:beta-mannosidase
LPPHGSSPGWTGAIPRRRDGSPPRWIPATVPGAVQLDWARAKGLPDFAQGSNVRQYDGLEDFHWLYRTTVPDAALAEGEQLVFACGGVEYA